ncbi:MAG TPA: patatin-like phospholipase family protein [Nitrososphaeraceae archaeon]|nr:patatin-like phospholipase family protein [Nitrososphaeraceae archaeon]
MNKNNGKRGTKSDHPNTSSNRDSSDSSNASLLPPLSSSSSSLRSSLLSPTNNRLENVLILQGGGSLGAFGCGVFKTLANSNIKLDIIAGTSIGGINAAIIAGSKDAKHPELLLEQFWLELSESFVDFDKVTLPSSASLPKFIDQLLLVLPSNNYYYHHHFPTASSEQENYSSTTKNANERAIKMKQLRSFYSSAIFGNDKMFKPRWRQETTLTDPEYFAPQNWTYMYDLAPLEKTLEKYIDYNKLKPNGNPNARLILTAVNVLTADPLTFDSSKQQITSKHILATSAYPLYNFPWIEVEDGVYAWDGGLLNNTPLREAIDASPVNDKRIFLVENYPKRVNALPKNLPEVYHRARDIMFSDKTVYNVKMSKVITLYLCYIEELYQLIETHMDFTKVDPKQLKRIRKKYKKYKQERGAEIKDIFYITRDEPFPHMYENADFSPETIKNSIREGEMKTIQALKGR